MKNNFTIIHIIAAYMVLIGHQFVLMGQTTPLLLGVDLHGLGVKILFVVSGYLVSASYFRSKNPIQFVWKRLSRLYPPLIACLIVTVLVMRIVTDTPYEYWRSAVSYFLHNVEMRPRFVLTGVFVNNPYPNAINGSLWTLPLEIACYFLVIPFLEAFKYLKRCSEVLAYAFFAVLLVSVSGFDLWRILKGLDISLVYWDTDWSNMLTLGLYFFIGVAFQTLNLSRICNMQIGVLVVILYICMPSYLKYFMTPYVISYLVLSFALTDNPLFHKSIKKDTCYGIYLYAFPVQQLLINLIIIKHNVSVSPYLMILAAGFIVTILAVAQYLFIEKPVFWRKSIDTRKD